MSQTASKETLESLHELIANELANVIRTGLPVLEGGELVRDAAGEIVRMPAPAAFFANAIKFLKDNDITAVLVPGSPLEGVIKSLPEFSDDDDDLPQYTN